MTKALKIDTQAFADGLLTKLQTIHKHYCLRGHYYGVVPVKLPNGRLLWNQSDLELLLTKISPEVEYFVAENIKNRGQYAGMGSKVLVSDHRKARSWRLESTCARYCEEKLHGIFKPKRYPEVAT
jgi:hypothetical protein